MRRKPFLPVAFVGGSRLDPAGSFVPTNTKQALSNMLQRRSGAVMQPPSLHAITSQQQLIQMKLLQQQQQQRLLRQAQTRPFQQVCPDQQCPPPRFISSSSSGWEWGCDRFLLHVHACLPVPASARGSLSYRLIHASPPLVFYYYHGSDKDLKCLRFIQSMPQNKKESWWFSSHLEAAGLPSLKWPSLSTHSLLSLSPYSVLLLALLSCIIIWCITLML